MKKEMAVEILLVSLFSTAFFLIFYGFHPLNPFDGEWLLGGGLDISQHYAGWLFYGRDSWRFPIGNFTGLSYPSEMSVVYLDSIPLVAVLGKLILTLFPGVTFQYFGWYELLCFILQGILAVVLVRKYMDGRLPRLLAGALFVVTPIFLWRVFLHVALSSQWILLLSLMGLVYYEDHYLTAKKRAVFWGFIGFLCTTIHLYLMPMCFLVLCGVCLMDLLNRDISWKKKLQRMAVTAVSFGAGLVLPMAALGGFMEGLSVSREGIVWKKSFNLNGFVNPQKWSRFFPNLSLHTYGQSEGFAYLGLGVFLLLLLSGGAALLLFRQKKGLAAEELRKLKTKKAAAIGLVMALSILAAASPHWTFGGGSILTLPLPESLEKLWSIFRACGRLVWPAVYLLELYGCVILCRCCQKLLPDGRRAEKAVSAALCVCLLLQLFDIGGRVWERGEISRHKTSFESELTDPGWDVIGVREDLVNIYYMGVSGMEKSASMAEYAYRYNKNLSSFYYARDYRAVTDQNGNAAMNAPAEEDLFLLYGSDTIRMWNHPQLCWYLLDDFLIGCNREIDGLAQQKKKAENLREYVSLCSMEAEGQTASDAEMIGGYLFLHAGGRYQSEGFTLPGHRTYRICLEGENLLEAEAGWVTESDRTKMDLTGKEIQKIEYEITAGDNPADIRMELDNPSEHDMVLYQITIEMIEPAREGR